MKRDFAIAIGMGLLWRASLPANAQPSPIAPIDNRSYRLIDVHHVDTRLIAWRLDPAHNSRPTEYIALENALFKLPAGVELVAPMRNEPCLLAFGTVQALQQLGGMVAELDKPLRQVEVNAPDSSLLAADPRTFDATAFQPNSGELSGRLLTGLERKYGMSPFAPISRAAARY